MKRALKVVVLIIAGFVAIWFSFYTEPLKKHQEKELIKQFSPNQLVDYHWKNDLDVLLRTSIDYNDFNSGMCKDAKTFSDEYAKVPGIGAKSCFLIHGKVKVKEVGDDAIKFDLSNRTVVRILTKYIFTNTARDASGWFNASDFQNTMDYNTLSSYLNNKILQKVANPFKVNPGDMINFWGAVEVSPEDYPVKCLDVIPLRLQTIKK
jgi:predicted lipoprotein